MTNRIVRKDVRNTFHFVIKKIQTTLVRNQICYLKQLGWSKNN